MDTSKIKGMLSRVRWTSVIALLLILLVLLFAFKYFTSGLGMKVKDDIGLKAWVDPDTINLHGASTLWVDVKNVGMDNMVVEIDAKASDPSLHFKETGNNTCNKNVSISPGESRGIRFQVHLAGAHDPGRYRIDIRASSARGENEAIVYLNVVKD